MSETPQDTWWAVAGLTLDEFYAKVRDRQPSLKVKFGCQPMATNGPMEVGWAERARRAKRQAGEQA